MLASLLTPLSALFPGLSPRVALPGGTFAGGPDEDEAEYGPGAGEGKGEERAGEDEYEKVELRVGGMTVSGRRWARAHGRQR